ncbi:MAG TPA: protein-tyrosine phosphatase family protein, partial [Ilumatobacteraceae bacterium]|nr:protein-tyrosine phosphatase family protein [Ilumatobacteraceae bacterium]
VSWRTQITEAERIRAIGWRLFDAAIGGLTELPWPHDRFVHAYWVRPGSVLAGEYPGDVDPIVAAQRVNLLIDHGVRTFIDLTRTSDGLAAYDAVVRNAAAARRLDIRRITHPIPNMGVLDQDGYDRIVASLQDASDRGAAYVHCWGGIGRTATVVGCLLVDGGMTANAAFTQIDQWRAGTRKAGLAAPQTEAQRAVVRARSEGARHT